VVLFFSYVEAKENRTTRTDMYYYCILQIYNMTVYNMFGAEQA